MTGAEPRTPHPAEFVPAQVTPTERSKHIRFTGTTSLSMYRSSAFEKVESRGKYLDIDLNVEFFTFELRGFSGAMAGM
jgi:hypothetical protein